MNGYRAYWLHNNHEHAFSEQRSPNKASLNKKQVITIGKDTEFIGGDIPKELYEWVQEKVKQDEFGSQAHAIRKGLLLLRTKTENESKLHLIETEKGAKQK